jgi:peptidoglycan/LPS O-acetylase OafA/YrhL
MSRTLPGAASPNADTSSERESQGTEQRMPALDGLRGLAIIAVLVYHFVSLAVADAGGGGPAFDSVLTKITGAGWVGVDLFFVLSGFLITGILYDTRLAQSGSYFRHFYARRCLRIFPAHYVYLALLFLLIPVLAPAAHGANDSLAHDRLWFVAYLGNILPAIHGAKRPDFFVTGHLWSLAVEEQFYLVWPAVVLLLGRRRLMMGCLIMIAGALVTRVTMTAAGVNGAASLTLAPARMDSLAIGALIALALRDPRSALALRRWLPPLAVGAAAAITVLSIWEGRLAALDGPSYTVGYTLIAIVFGALLLKSLSARPGSAFGRLVAAPPLRSAGKYSYAMYLVHLPIAWLLFQRTDLAVSVPTLFGSHVPGELAFAAAAAVPTFALAWLSWRLLEGPLLRLKTLFPYASVSKVETPPAPRPVPFASEGPAG